MRSPWQILQWSMEKNISHQPIEGIKSNCIREDVKWPRTPPALPAKFLWLCKDALTKCFLTSYSTNANNCILQYASQLGPWTTQIQRKWWKCQYNNQLYKQSSNKWEVFTQYPGQRSFAHSSTTQDDPLNLSPISVSKKGGGWVSVDVLPESLTLTVIPQQDLLSDFEDHLGWSIIWDSVRFASLD